MPKSTSRPLLKISESVDDKTLSAYLRFSPDSGHIRLFDQRMLLMHADSLAHLRMELIERLGLDKTRELFTRMGYQQGISDARCLRDHEGGALEHTLALGPRLREMEGFVRNQAVDQMQFNAQSGEFWGDYFWRASWEAEAHLEHFGVSGNSACWLMVGYASGYTTTIMGRPIVWEESECVASGHKHCRVIGKPLEDAADAEPHLRFLQIEDFVAPPRRRSSSKSSSKRARSETFAQSLPDLVGASTGFNTVVHMLRRVAPTAATVLFLGESGVGKERFSRSLHAIGPRADQPFISVNCAAIPDDLVEAELFGVEKGAFTGAISSRAGRFERANGGSLFLDEISSLPLSAQGKLLRILQEGELERVGDSQIRTVDVRIIAAANSDLRDQVAAGQFREDLFFRLNVFPIEIPPLRDRREDIPLMVNVFLDRFAQRFDKHIVGLTQEASTALWDYHWPGNVRELENIIERAVILADDGGSLDVQHLFSGGEHRQNKSLYVSQSGNLTRGEIKASHGEDALDEHLKAVVRSGAHFEQIEERLLKIALSQSNGNVSAAARALGMRRGQFEYRLRKSRPD